MVLTESFSLKIGTPAPDFNLRGVDLQNYSLENFSDAKILVVIFMCNHCPYVQAVWARLIELQKKYAEKSVRFVGINSNINPDYPEDSFENMQKYYHDYGMNFPYLEDKTQDVARNYFAKCTPDIFVYDEQRKLIYHGRIDDNWKNADMVTRHDLDDAISAYLSHGKIIEEQFPSMGCSIKWLANLE